MCKIECSCIQSFREKYCELFIVLLDRIFRPHTRELLDRVSGLCCKTSRRNDIYTVVFKGDMRLLVKATQRDSKKGDVTAKYRDCNQMVCAGPGTRGVTTIFNVVTK